MSDASAVMPEYACHKRVWALKIKDVQMSPPDVVFPGGSWELEVEDEGFSPIRVSYDFYVKHAPSAGGYYVVYKDGYKSFSPADAFEGGYTRL